MTKSLILFFTIILYTVPALAVVVTPNSIVNVTNAPANSLLIVECGPSTGVYTFTKEFPMGAGGTVPFKISDVLTAQGNYFCRAKFASTFGGNYGVGANSAEFNITVNSQGAALVAPTFTVVP